MSKDLFKFDKTLESYVYLRENCAVRNREEEAGFDLDIYTLKDYADELYTIASNYSISVFRISDDSDIDEFNEYIIYLEHKLCNELEYRLKFMYQYDK